MVSRGHQTTSTITVASVSAKMAQVYFALNCRVQRLPQRVLANTPDKAEEKGSMQWDDFAEQ